MRTIVKRDGSEVEFNADKITTAVANAFKSSNEIPAWQIPYKSRIITEVVLGELMDKYGSIDEYKTTVEDVQDIVENVLMRSNMIKTAKMYVIYREQHRKNRDTNTLLDYKKLVDDYLKVNDWRVKENSTVTHSLGGLVLSNNGAITANYWLSEVYDKDIADAHRNAEIHIHDLSLLAPYCGGWNLKQLIQEGLGGVTGKISSKPASHLSTLCNQMVNFLGTLQNCWSGAQAFSSFDTYLAPFVKADNLDYHQVKQCIQSFVFGVNTPSRWGCVDTETEVLSVDGWKKYDELKEGDLIYTWNEGRLEINPVNKVVIKNYKGKMHSYQGRHYNQFVSPDHRVLIKNFNKDTYTIKHSSEIFDVRTPYPLPAKFKSSELRGVDLTDDEIRLAAAVYTDGNLDFRKDSIHKVTIYKSPNRVGNEYILDANERLNLNCTVSSVDGEFGTLNTYIYYGDEARRIVNLVGSKKKIADIFFGMNKKQAKLFLKTWSEFDGSGPKFLLQYDNNTIRDQLQQIAILGGYTSYIRHKNKTNYVKIRKNDTVTPKAREEYDYDGIIWCPNVDNGTAVFRRDGNTFISGQCQAPFTNITLDWVCPKDLANLPAIVGGKEMDFTYGDCKKEMDMVNKAFIEIMIEGDANGRGFQYPIPSYSITKDFDWSDTENNRLLFEMTAKYGTPYFSNYINSDMEPSDVRSMCCRLRLDLRELRRKGGGFFGAGESTGSIGVVTINLPHIAYEAENEEEFYQKLDSLMDIAARSLKMKRNVVSDLLDKGLYPYTKRYLGSFDNHFSTIGLVGMNEAGLNAKWLKKDLTYVETQQFAKDVLNHMRERLSDYQELYGDLYNLEATPAESTSYRFAKHDKEKYPDIITANEHGTPYYTNSSHLPVGYTDDVFAALDIQDELQTLYTSGTVFHAFLGEKLPDWKAAANLVRKIAENYKLPYYTMSPTYSICPDHGYLTGEQYTCPHCGKTTEVYSRITGYYRPVQNWNDGKTQEFKDRKVYDLGTSHMTTESTDELKHFKYSDKILEHIDADKAVNIPAIVSDEPGDDTGYKPLTMECESCKIDTGDYGQEELVMPVAETDEPKLMLFTTHTCPNCARAKEYLAEAGIDYQLVYADDDKELARKYKVMMAPTMIEFTPEGYNKHTGVSGIIMYIHNR